MMFYSKAEKEAYKAGIKKGQRISVASRTIEAEALDDLWETLGASNQTEAMAKAEDQRETNLSLAVRLEVLKKERDTSAAIAETLRNQLQSGKTELQSALAGCQKRVDELAAELNSAKKHRDDLKQVLEHADKEADRLRENIRGKNAKIYELQQRCQELATLYENSVKSRVLGEPVNEGSANFGNIHPRWMEPPFNVERTEADIQMMAFFRRYTAEIRSILGLD